jgi:uncharacterized protein (TIGR02594 family)
MMMTAPQAVARTTRTDETPPWLAVMKTLTGTKEVSGPEANPVITGMTTEIARIWNDVPGMKAYCDQPAWDSDETAWCGVAAGYCLSEAGFMPPFGATDTDRFGWAQSWADDPNYIELTTPVPGAIVVMTRSGGGHVTFYESDAGSNINCRGGNQSNSVNLSAYPKSSVIGYFWPKLAPMPDQPRRELSKGDTGPDVAELQTSLGIPADGDFGAITEAQVCSFQAAAKLGADGVVGPDTWAAVDDLDARMAAGENGLSDELCGMIVELVGRSPLANYSWPARGKAPRAYLNGMAMAYAVAVLELEEGFPRAVEMAQAERADDQTDALTWYRSEFAAKGMDNSQPGLDTLRHLFVMMIGLGMRESSGLYYCGRDTTASNTSSDTCEAGLFQTSWNIRSCSVNIQPLLVEYWDDPNGFLPAFQEGLSPTASGLGSFGTGDGARYQFLAKFAPSFHAFVTGIGMRKLRKHWGPINRKEVTINKDADTLLAAVQALALEGPIPVPPEPIPPVGEVATVDIVTTGKVIITINGVTIGTNG